MADLIFYTNPQSRGQMVRWMLEEVGVPYETEVLTFGGTMKAEPYLAVNPMGKVPAIKHHGKVVTEVAAICAYLADAFPDAGLAPPTAERADYYRFLFFAAGPIEQAFSLKAVELGVPQDKQAMFGFGNHELPSTHWPECARGPRLYHRRSAPPTSSSRPNWLHDDVRAGSSRRRPFASYVARCTDRDAYRRGKQNDGKLIAECPGLSRSSRQVAGRTSDAPQAIAPYDRFTHEGMPRREFMARMVALAGSAAAAEALIGSIAASPAAAAIVPEDDQRLTIRDQTIAGDQGLCRRAAQPQPQADRDRHPRKPRPQRPYQGRRPPRRRSPAIAPSRPTS